MSTISGSADTPTRNALDLGCGVVPLAHQHSYAPTPIYVNGVRLPPPPNKPGTREKAVLNGRPSIDTFV